ncbi:putative tubulin alpha chain [Neospora caninum Liverpool]|uniref:Tubulin alpha chain n=1 Tax=Neospora caninum (strain Liverpool) TaxID=572307 RepID=F0VI18_NEOCL|nr:putative tubulin alpha chain [Neospora caninum Liverpool]CBZ53379.1 putative tubulin alpha chain [Neospora caninum Liverpool]CEL67365.1 TPA: tubulin alpha chain, putative [Neospora caninum Liverpool]|eukprot:XP_003883411.1 putative tubulin alpha chain [Neospora caninum Liverpool]
MPGEVVTVQCGQAGEQLGFAFWELLLAEHGLTYEGSPGKHNAPEGCQNNVDCFFYEAHSGRRVPRSAMIDLDNSAESLIGWSPIRRLFDEDFFISHKEDASNNFARGYIAVGRSVLSAAVDAVRRQAEMCDSLQCFFLCRALGGGTGSGLGSLLLENIAEHFGKKYILDSFVWPYGSQTASVVEPYNAVLAAPAVCAHSSAALLVNNTALFNICRSLLNIESVFHSNLNHLVAQVLSATTLSTRFEGSLNSTIEHTLVNTIPYPELKFLTASLAPLANRLKYRYERASTKDLTMQCILPSRCLSSIDYTQNRSIACHIMYRGDVTPRDVQDGIAAVKQHRALTFVDWVPTGLKCSLNNRLMCVSPESELAPAYQSCCMLANNTGITSLLEKTLGDMRKMFSQRACVHWFVGEGLEEGQFLEAEERLQRTIDDYHESLMDFEYVYEYEDDSHEDEKKTPPSEATTEPSSPVHGTKQEEKEPEGNTHA